MRLKDDEVLRGGQPWLLALLRNKEKVEREDNVDLVVQQDKEFLTTRNDQNGPE